MIVLLDMDHQKLEVYGEKGLKRIPFQQAQDLFECLDSDTVYYVTNAMEVSAFDIINLIKSMGVQIRESFPMTDTGAKYIHAATDGTIYINDALKFEGKFDCKVYDADMEAQVRKSPVLQALVKNKKLQIIGEARRQAIMKEWKKEIDKQQALQRQADAQLDSIILKTRVEDFDPNAYPDDDIPGMDITADVNRGNFETEEERLARMIGRGR